jgi:hypothetical protein
MLIKDMPIQKVLLKYRSIKGAQRSLRLQGRLAKEKSPMCTKLIPSVLKNTGIKV